MTKPHTFTLAITGLDAHDAADVADRMRSYGRTQSAPNGNVHLTPASTMRDELQACIGQHVYVRIANYGVSGDLREVGTDCIVLLRNDENVVISMNLIQMFYPSKP